LVAKRWLPPVVLTPEGADGQSATGLRDPITRIGTLEADDGGYIFEDMFGEEVEVMSGKGE
jgi:hypothetical protein